MTENIKERKPISRLNEPLPDFEAITTHGNIKLSGFARSVYVQEEALETRFRR